MHAMRAMMLAKFKAIGMSFFVSMALVVASFWGVDLSQGGVTEARFLLASSFGVASEGVYELIKASAAIVLIEADGC